MELERSKKVSKLYYLIKDFMVLLQDLIFRGLYFFNEIIIIIRIKWVGFEIYI